MSLMTRHIFMSDLSPAVGTSLSNAMSSKQVILCRSIAGNDDTHNEYIDTFQSAGYDCYHLPTLQFEFASLEQLKGRLLSPDLYGGLIVTSRRAVEAIGLALQGNSLPEQWNNLPAYCVGASTASLVESNLKLNKRMGSECGNAKDLANYIVRNASKDARALLYPCSGIARDTIERVLHDNEISLEKIIVYNTFPAETLEADLERIISGKAQIFVFFSPSSVEYVVTATRERTEILQKIEAVAIGPASAEALAKAGMTVHAVASKPEPEALLHAIQIAGL